MNKLTAEQIIILNKKLVDHKNFLPSEECVALVSQIADAPYQREKMFLYKHRDTIDRAIVLGSEIIKQRPFESENGKTALLAVLTMLELNGFRFTHGKGDIEELYHVLREQNTLKCREWINGHTVAENIQNLKENREE